MALSNKTYLLKVRFNTYIHFSIFMKPTSHIDYFHFVSTFLCLLNQSICLSVKNKCKMKMLILVSTTRWNLGRGKKSLTPKHRVLWFVYLSSRFGYHLKPLWRIIRLWTCSTPLLNPECWISLAFRSLCMCNLEACDRSNFVK